MSLASTFSTSVVESIDGQEVEFKYLTLSDYADWIDRLYERQKVADAKLIPSDASPSERFEMLRRINRVEPTLSQISDMVMTLKGAKRVLTTSLKKSGRTEAEAKEITEKIRPSRLVELAIRVSDLFVLREPAGPNAGTPASNAGDSTGTGSLSGCSLNISDAETSDD